MLTLEFIAGFVSAQGSFIKYTRNGHTYPAFQIKSSVENSSLLNQIASTLNLHNKVYNYNKAGRSYSLLLVRDRDSLLKKIIPALEGRIIGARADVYNQWKNAIIANSSTWKYRNIKVSGNPEHYIIVDKSPNNLSNGGG